MHWEGLEAEQASKQRWIDDALVLVVGAEICALGVLVVAGAALMIGGWLS